MKNQYKIIDDKTISIIIIHKNKEYDCYIDIEDLAKVSCFKTTWHLSVDNNHIEGVRTKVQKNKNRKQIWIHNLIYNKENSDNVVEHIDHNPLNNRKSNLRELTKKENAQNINPKLRFSSTGYRNITLDRNKYRVRINHVNFGRYLIIKH